MTLKGLQLNEKVEIGRDDGPAGLAKDVRGTKGE
jgi:hypothetical protein